MNLPYLEYLGLKVIAGQVKPEEIPEHLALVKKHTRDRNDRDLAWSDFIHSALLDGEDPETNLPVVKAPNYTYAPRVSEIVNDLIMRMTGMSGSQLETLENRAATGDNDIHALKLLLSEALWNMKDVHKAELHMLLAEQSFDSDDGINKYIAKLICRDIRIVTDEPDEYTCRYYSAYDPKDTESLAFKLGLPDFKFSRPGESFFFETVDFNELYLNFLNQEELIEVPETPQVVNCECVKEDFFETGLGLSVIIIVALLTIICLILGMMLAPT